MSGGIRFGAVTHRRRRRAAAGLPGVQQLAAGRVQERAGLAVPTAAGIPRLFGDRPVAVLGAPPGGFGTVLAQNAWRPVLRTLQMRPWFGGRLMVSGAHKLFDDQGLLSPDKTREALREFLAGFVSFVAA